MKVYDVFLSLWCLLLVKMRLKRELFFFKMWFVILDVSFFFEVIVDVSKENYIMGKILFNFDILLFFMEYIGKIFKGK